MAITVHLIEPDGRRHTVTAAPAIIDEGGDVGQIDGIAADCGGCMTCATCHVIVDPAWIERLPAASADEDAMLDTTAVPRQPTSRLSCQIALEDGLDGLVAGLPESQY